jgi:phosphoglycolate phosphatase
MDLPGAAAFDLDGTLINTLPSIHSSLNETFKFYGHDLQNEQFVKERIGLPVVHFFAHLCLPNEVVVKLIRHFREFLKQNLSSREDVYPGVKELLTFLAEKDCRLAIATSKPTELAILTLTNTGLYTYFDEIVGTDNGCHKPDPWVLNEVMRRMDTKLNLFVGDRLEDAGAAAAASIPFAAVLNSIHTRQEFELIETVGVFENFWALKLEVIGH